jgi:hypothetical protein
MVKSVYNIIFPRSCGWHNAIRGKKKKKKKKYFDPYVNFFSERYSLETSGSPYYLYSKKIFKIGVQDKTSPDITSTDKTKPDITF